MFKLKNKKKIFLSPATGTILSLEEVDDPVFANKMMGDGLAIELSDGEIVAPFDCEVTMAFPTGHAYGLKSKDGIEVLIHLGLDTVELKGLGFNSHVSVGMCLNQGECLVNIDLDIIRENHKSLVSPIIFTSGEKISIVSINRDIKILDDIIKIK